MAAKKKAAPKKATAKKVPAPKKSVAVKTLGSLPALTGKLRMAYRAAFTDDQCDAWGKQTKAENVVKEAEKFVATMERSLKEHTDSTYSRRRLTFLCELLVLLEDEISRTSKDEMVALRATRSAVLEVANNARRDLARRLRAVAGGQQTVLKEISAVAPASENSPSDVQDSLTATIDLAQKLRRNDVMETLADDVGLTEARLNSAYAALEALTGAGDVSLNAAAYEGDAPSVNRIEGRVLREMRLAQRLFREGREAGQNLPSLVAGPSLKVIFGNDADDSDAPAPTPPPN
ncbi:MAG: hypothetical protein JNM17_25020 [Archangium sp.]|nr:hypothetical protein [Archangium sp.]